MKKLVITLILFIFGGYVNAGTNRPIIMRGLNGHRSRSAQTTERPRRPHDVTTDAIRRFVEKQNPDGSWGADGTQQLATALCLISFLRHGEPDHSETLGKPGANAHAWLMAAQPRTDPERVATAIALSDYITVHSRWHDHYDDEKKPTVPPEQIQKIQNCITAISPQCEEMWQDLLLLSHLPQEISHDLDRDAIQAIFDKYLDRAPDGVPSTLDDYLLLYLTTLARFNQGAKAWIEWNRQLVPMLIRSQEPDGLFPCQTEHTRIAATSFSVMSFSVYYITSHQFLVRPRPKKHKREDQEN